MSSCGKLGLHCGGGTASTRHDVHANRTVRTHIRTTHARFILPQKSAHTCHLFARLTHHVLHHRPHFFVTWARSIWPQISHTIERIYEFIPNSCKGMHLKKAIMFISHLKRSMKRLMNQSLSSSTQYFWLFKSTNKSLHISTK